MATKILEITEVTVPESYIPKSGQLIRLQEESNTPYLLSISKSLYRWAHKQDTVDKIYKTKSPEVWSLLTQIQDLAEEVTRSVVQRHINENERDGEQAIDISHEYAFDFLSSREDIRPQLEILICRNIVEILEKVSPSTSNSLIAQTLFYSSYLYFRNME